MRYKRALSAAGAAILLSTALPTTASAAPGPLTIHEWSSQALAPFSLAVDGTRVLVADGGTEVIGQLLPDGSIAPVIEGVPGLAGLATRGAWMAYGSSDIDDATEPPVISASGLNIRRPSGETIYADLHAYEYSQNPDAGNVYGILDPTSCAAGMNHPGLLDSHAYAVASRQGEWLVADAGANALFSVSDEGSIGVVAVLPPIPVTLTAEHVAMLGIGDCAIGDTYHAEPVPTGVAVGRGGAIYVSTLPGFPGESAGLGGVWRVDPATGDVTAVASGLAGATSVAVSGSDLYVAQLFGAGVARVSDGSTTLLAELLGSLSVAAAPNGTIWAATMASEAGPGRVVSISNRKVKVQATLR